jgi:AraC family transcriptional activator of pobA
MQSSGVDLTQLESSLPADQLVILPCGPLHVVMTSDPITLNQELQDVHSKYEFLIPLATIPHFYVDKKKMDCRPGQLIVINPGQQHGINRPVKTAAFIALMYKADYLEDLIMRMTGTAAQPFPSEPFLLQSDIQILLTSLIQEHQNKRLGRDLLISSLTDHLAIMLVRHYYQTRQNLMDLYPQPLSEDQLRFQPVIEYMHEHLSEKLNIDQLASLTRMNRFHFIRAFKQAFAHSPYDFLTDLRIAQAKRLLIQTKLSANDIGRLCGFFSASRFSAAFRQSCSMTPSAYRYFAASENRTFENLPDQYSAHDSYFQELPQA